MTEVAVSEFVSNGTPSGLLVEYRAEPRQYRVNGVDVPSVTHVLDILHKPALTWWGMKIGIEGVGQLYRATVGEDGPLPLNWHRNVDAVVAALTEHKLTVNHVRDKAATRGSSVHDALETWARTGHKPDARDYPPQESGYVQGLLKFIEETTPQPIEAELMVGSARHGYAGRFDLLAELPTKRVKTGPRTERLIPSGIGILDLKTSKNAYPSHHLQLAAYAEAAEECGHGRTDYEAVILVRENGTYDFIVSEARFSQFLDVRRAYEALRGLK